jgi:riboflavin biosynthesis pyrimidine reductase
MTGIIAPMRRLHPYPADHVTVADAYGIDRPRPVNRPWLGLCMVSSLDGTTVVEGNSRALSSDADLAVLLGLRRLADMMLVGAATVRIEGYGPPSKPGQRVGVVSRSGDLDYSSELFTSGAGFVILPVDAPEVPADSIRAGHGSVDLAAALEQLDADFIQVEGGAVLNATLAEADLIDELNLTVSPLVCGGSGPRITSGALPLLNRMDLAHVLEDDGFLFTRYVRARPAG